MNEPVIDQHCRTDDVVRVFVLRNTLLFYQALELAISDCEAITIVGSTSDPEQLIALVGSDRFDLLLVEGDPAEDQQVDLVRRIRAKSAALKIIMVGDFRREESLIRFIEAGANGYVLGRSSLAELIETIKLVHCGKTTCSPRIAALVGERLRQLSREFKSPGRRFDLTAREREMLQLIARGLSNKEIAYLLGIQVRTVKTHLHNLFKKLEVHGRRDAIRTALKHQLLTGSRQTGSRQTGSRQTGSVTPHVLD